MGRIYIAWKKVRILKKEECAEMKHETRADWLMEKICVTSKNIYIYWHEKMFLDM